MATVWYAQATGNINDVGMWNSASDGSGNTLTWANLDPTDTLRANGKTSVTINVNTTCAQIDTLTNGGRFILADGITLTADVVAGTSYCVSFPSGSAAIVGDITGGSSGLGSHGVTHASTGTLTITGNVTGGSASNARGINVTSTGSTTVTGAVTGGSGGATFGIATNNGAGLVTVTGDVTGGTNIGADGLSLGVSVVATVVGNAIAATAPAVLGVSASHLKFDGNSISTTAGVVGLAARNLSIVDGTNHYTDYAEADTTPGDVTGELVRHYGLGALPTPAEVAAAVWTYEGTAGRTLTG